MKKMKNLQEAINKLNAPKEYDGEIFESHFKFVVKEEDGKIIIVDENENYYIDYLEEQNSLLYDCANELGFEFKPMLEDKIMEQLEEAIKKDFGKDGYIEWHTNIEMIIAR